MTSEFLPVAGDRFSQIKADTTGVTAGEKGDNIRWNFNLTFSKDSVTIFYVGINTTPVAEVFPTSNLASFVTLKNVNVYTYYQMLPNEIIYLGTANYSKSYIFSIPLQNPKTVFQFPFAYKDTLNREFSFYLESGSIRNYYYGNFFIDYDSYGKLKINDREYDCIRLHTIDYYGDSKNFKDSQYSNYIESFEWYISENKFPLFTIRYTNKKSKERITKLKEVLFTAN
ncbi:MAG: hypothetical protein JSS63_01425 [Bacteroidetes bacterium]|nr:hypothetical protein [Bacteroidota bacterium]MBX7045640.1 hypothetical protein [Ignavibacteria bacterium]